MRDDQAMDRARALGAAARRHAPPWPWVGCVVARDGEVVGEGTTGPYPTGPHAEVAALRAAGARARGATVYVTLEPCDHHGNTPPCARALVDAGVARVVVGVPDPDARVSGRGVARLRAAGVEVVEGVGAGETAAELAPYLHHRRTGSAFVVAKVAASLDGRIAAADGTSRWITAERARADAHALRAESQAVVIGSGTALADRPRLTVRDAPTPRLAPSRVLLDARGRVAPTGALFDVELAPTLVVTTERAPTAARDAWAAAGAKVAVVEPGAGGGVDLREAFALLGREGVLQALVEGGGALLGAVLDGGHAQRLVTYVAPLFLGTRALPAFDLPGPASVDDARRFRLSGATVLGPDVRLDYDLLDDGAHLDRGLRDGDA